jgi:hypothetical protein
MESKLLASLCILVSFLLWTDPSLTSSPPTVDSVTVSNDESGDPDPLNLTEGTTTPVYIFGTITDTNGCLDVYENGTIEGKFFISNVSGGANCNADQNDCYDISALECTLSECDGEEDNSFEYSCTIPLAYFANSTQSGPDEATDWTAKIKAIDASSGDGFSQSTTEVNSLLALSFDEETLDYGNVDMGGLSAEATLNIINSGNTGLDILVSSDNDLVCDGEGSEIIPVSQIHFSATSSFDWETEGIPLTEEDIEFELNLAPQTDDENQNQEPIYSSILLPETGLRGICSNTITVNGIADEENDW